MAHQAVIGLECHIQLSTRSKMFCGCAVEFGAAADSRVCPVCLGLPGALPTINRAAIDAAVRLGLALGSAVQAHSVFARKHYFYPDMPKNYQISQYDQPLCVGGTLPVEVDGVARRFELTRVHVEEDTGKSFHPEKLHDRRVSRVEFNRAGVPLLELVTEPVFHAAAESAAFLTALRRLIRWLGISDGDMEKGQLRCDANVSIRELGATALGTKTELKNLNSIKGVEKGITAEIARQSRLLDGGGHVQQATLLYDADHDKLAVMRTKEHAHDYRYLPEPDLPLLQVDAAWVADARSRLPELPWEVDRRLADQDGLPPEVASIVTSDRELVALLDDLVRAGARPRSAANWVANTIVGHLNKRAIGVDEFRRQVPIDAFATLLSRVDAEQVTVTAARGLLDDVLAGTADASTVFASGGSALSSAEALLPMVRAVMVEHPGPVAQYRAGRVATLGFLVGQVMKQSGGQAAPQTVQRLLQELLAAEQ